MNDLERLAGPTTAHDIHAWAGNLLRRARSNTGTSTSELAHLSGIREDVITAIETGQLQPTLPELSQLLIAMGKELRIRLEDFDDHDKVLDERAVAFPELHAAMQAGMDSFLAAVTEQPPVASTEHGRSDRSEPLPIYRVAQPTGRDVAADLTTPGVFGDLTFTTHSGDRTTQFSAYHTGETAIFIDVLSRYLAHQSVEERRNSLDTVRAEVARVTADRVATERGEDSFTRQQLEALRRPAEAATPPVGRYRTSGDGCDLVLTPTTNGFDIALESDDGATRVFSWPTEMLWQLIAGIIWRSYAEPDDDFSMLSRVPTSEFLNALQAAEPAL